MSIYNVIVKNAKYLCLWQKVKALDQQHLLKIKVQNVESSYMTHMPMSTCLVVTIAVPATIGPRSLIIILLGNKENRELQDKDRTGRAMNKEVHEIHSGNCVYAKSFWI